jgi:hypothetical protein
MNREILIEQAVKKIRQLPDNKIQQVNDFADFLLSKIADKILLEGIRELASGSKSFEYLIDEDDLYSVDDLKEMYK